MKTNDILCSLDFVNLVHGNTVYTLGRHLLTMREIPHDNNILQVNTAVISSFVQVNPTVITQVSAINQLCDADTNIGIVLSEVVKISNQNIISEYPAPANKDRCDIVVSPPPKKNQAFFTVTPRLVDLIHHYRDIY